MLIGFRVGLEIERCTGLYGVLAEGPRILYACWIGSSECATESFRFFDGI